MAAAGDREAEELLVTRYYGMVRACARPLFLAGGDFDLVDELGLAADHEAALWDYLKRAAFAMQNVQEE